MRLTGEIYRFPEARFTSSGEYRVYFDIQVSPGLSVPCVMKDAAAEDWIMAIYNEWDDERLPQQVAIRGVETIRRFKAFDGTQKAHSYVNVTELVCRVGANDEPTKFKNGWT